MSGFHFSCESVLRLRKHEVDMLQNKIRQSRQMLKTLGQQRKELKQRRTRIGAQRYQTGREGLLDLNLVAAAEHSVRKIEAAADQIDVRIAQMKRKTNSLQDDLLKILTRIEALDQLRDREYLDWKRTRQNIEERAEQDLWRVSCRLQ